MITDSNQACITKMSGCGLQEESNIVPHILPLVIHSIISLLILMNQCMGYSIRWVVFPRFSPRGLHRISFAL